MRRGVDVQTSEIPLLNNVKLARRMLLGLTNSCYDLLGLLAWLINKMKIELRDLYQNELNLTWDKDILQEKDVWVFLLQLFKSAESLQLRCISDVSSNKNPELIVFNYFF